MTDIKRFIREKKITQKEFPLINRNIFSYKVAGMY